MGAALLLERVSPSRFSTTLPSGSAVLSTLTESCPLVLSPLTEISLDAVMVTFAPEMVRLDGLETTPPEALVAVTLLPL